MKERCYHRVTNVFRSVFSGKVYCVRGVVEAQKSGTPCFFVLLSTIILIDSTLSCVTSYVSYM